MADIVLPGVVVYSVVENNKGQMFNVRIETQGDGKPPLEHVFGNGSLTRMRFNQLVKTAHQPLAISARRELRSSLMSADLSIDAGKRVFFKDVDFYGLLPKTLGIKNGITVGSKTVQDALENRRSIEGVRLDPEKFAGFMGYPETDTDLADVFGKQKTAGLPTWQQHASTLRTMAVSRAAEKYTTTAEEK